MYRDYKTGMLLGLVLVMIAIIRFLTTPNLSLEATILNSSSTKISFEEKEGDRLPPRYVGDLQDTPALEDDALKTQTKPLEIPKKTVKNVQSAIVHIVISGETLSSISEKYYGNISGMQKIINANKITNPDRLKPGTSLLIPE